MCSPPLHGVMSIFCMEWINFVNSLYSNYLLAYPAALSAGHRSADMTEWSLNNKLSSRGFGLVFHCFVV